MKYSPNELFRAWGAAQRKLPGTHDALRAHIVEHAHPRAAAVARAPRGIRWPALAFATLAAIAFLAQPERYLATRSTTSVPLEASNSAEAPRPSGAFRGDDIGYGSPASLGDESTSVHGLSAPNKSIAPWYPYPVPPEPQTPPITDDRELLEWVYRAALRTRHVEEVGARSQTVVRGHGGRIDGVSLSDTYGSVRFAVPVARFDAFRAELATLAVARFLFTENVSAENRLPEQQSIESSLRDTEESLTAQKNERATTAEYYRGRIAGQQRAVGQKTTERNAARAALDALTADAPDRAAATARLQSLDRELSALQRELRRLTTERDNRLATIDGVIRSLTDSIAQLHTRETNLAAEVATVQGTITITRIDYGTIAATFFRNHWLSLVLLALAGLALIRFRSRRLELPTT